MNFRIKVILVPVIAVFVSSSPVGACDLQQMKTCNLTDYASPSEFAALQRYLLDFKKKHQQKIAAPERSRGKSPPLSAMANTTKAPSPDDKKIDPNVPPEAVTSLKFLLRKDFADVNLFAAPQSDAAASGAEFSFSRDNIAKDSTWAGTGLVAVAYSYFVEDIHSPFVGFTIAPYVSFNRELHSSKVSNNVDTSTLGISGEVGWQNPVFTNGKDYVRGRFAAVRDDVLDSNNASGTIEWLPTYAWFAGTVPGTLMVYNFTPEGEVQYDSTTTAGKTLMFSGRKESLRVGPEAVLWMGIYDPAGTLPDFLHRITANVTYHWWSELYSGRDDSWLDASLTYKLDDAGHLGLKVAYNRGRSEDTGALFDLYKVTLTAKLCTDVFSKTSC
jgi:hypothetical protein